MSVRRAQEVLPVVVPVLALVLLLGAAASSVRGQESDPEAQPATPAQTAAEDAAETAATEPPAGEEGEPRSDLIGDLLTASEDSFESVGEAFYDPGNRRDPFRSLLRVTEPSRVGGPRPEGIPGLLVSELSLEGIWLTREGPVAQVLSSDNPVSYLLHEGDRLYDGEVLHIRYERGVGGEVVFRQENDDPNAPKPFKETTLRLAQ